MRNAKNGGVISAKAVLVVWPIKKLSVVVYTQSNTIVRNAKFAGFFDENHFARFADKKMSVIVYTQSNTILRNAKFGGFFDESHFGHFVDKKIERHRLYTK